MEKPLSFPEADEVEVREITAEFIRLVCDGDIGRNEADVHAFVSGWCMSHVAEGRHSYARVLASAAIDSILETLKTVPKATGLRLVT